MAARSALAIQIQTQVLAQRSNARITSDASTDTGRTRKAVQLVNVSVLWPSVVCTANTDSRQMSMAALSASVETNLYPVMGPLVSWNALGEERKIPTVDVKNVNAIQRKKSVDLSLVEWNALTVS